MQRTPKPVSTNDKVLVRACEIANQEGDIALIEQEFDSLLGELPEPWNESAGQG